MHPSSQYHKELAHIVSDTLKSQNISKKEIKIFFEESNDNRSYHINSDKINFYNL